MSMVEEINNAVADALGKLSACTDAAQVEAVRIEFLGRNGFFTVMGKNMGGLAPEERKTAGKAFNLGRKEVESAIAGAAAELSQTISIA